MAFKNRIRLPFKITRPQFPETRVNFRKANGTTHTLSVVIRKEYEGETDFMPEGWHEKLKIAFGHDSIRIEGDRYLGDIAQTGEYNIEWPDFLDYPTSKAKFKAEVTPFAETNSNCMTCEEAMQLELVDDTITALYGDPLQEGQTYEWNVAENDSICCYPATFSAFWYNTDYLTAFSIDQAGVVSVTLGTDLVSANGLKIATYRVTCPNGGYDEADIFANIEGSIEGCLAPTGLTVTTINPTSLTFEWVEPFTDATYYYELYAGTLPVGSPVASGTLDIITTVEITGLDPDTAYYFQVRTVCYGSNSNFIALETATAVQGESCGSYTLEINDGTGDPSTLVHIRYTACGTELGHAFAYNGTEVVLCMLQNAPGNPIYVNNVVTGITYNGLC